MPISRFIDAYDGVLLDLDGCLWVGDAATPRAVEAVAALRAAGKRVGFITNDARQSEEEFVRKLWGLGFQASVHEVVTVGGATQHFLAERTDRLASALVVGSQALFDHVAASGVRIVNHTDLDSRADVVVVGGGDNFDYSTLRAGTLAIARGAPLIATASDRVYPMPDGLWPGTGAMTAAFEYASEVQAHFLGKPAPEIFTTALDRLEVEAERTVMVGDRLEGDIAGALGAGLAAALVLTGIATRDEADAALDAAPAPAADARRPDAVAADLGTLVLGADGL